MNRWRVQIHGKAGDRVFEISVINFDKIRGCQKYFGWFDENKLLVTHNGGPCNWPIIPMVWDGAVQLAERVSEEMNKKTNP